jgi:hypothetical protein
MFLIAPKDESNGDASFPLDRAIREREKYETLYRIKPSLKHAVNLACVWHMTGDGKMALKLIETCVEAIENEPNAVPPEGQATIYLNRGMFLRGFGRMKEAARDIWHARELDKSSAFIAMAAAEEHLRFGDWEKGWKLHNQTRGTCEAAALAVALPYTTKFWDGKEHPEHLLVINEGGAGDRINYTRWLPELSRRGIRWSFFCFDEFKPFYDRLPWIGPERTIGEAQKKEFAPPPSHWTTTFSLPGPLGASPDAIPAYPAPYSPARRHIRFDRADSRPLVGLSWNANELFQGGLKVRSLTEGQAMRLVSLTADKICWVNLQHKHKMPFPVLNVPFSTWEDTASLISELDAVVTVDCGTLWMSLALEKPTTVLLTAPEDWKFSSSWGPHLSVYRNGESDNPFDAEKAIDRMILDIRQDKFEAARAPSMRSTTSLRHMSAAAD